MAKILITNNLGPKICHLKDLADLASTKWLRISTEPVKSCVYRSYSYFVVKELLLHRLLG